MDLLGIDVGSSSVKARMLRNGRMVGVAPRIFFRTRRTADRAEVAPAAVMRALREAVAAIGPAAGKADAIALAVMAPAWVAIDWRGNALTPIVTHQDRRSVEEARQIESAVGKKRHLRLAGNRPFPGGISSTTWAWYKRHEPERLRQVDLVGHLSTFLHRRLTGARVTDPSNASFTGLYRTCELGGWSDELCEAAGVSRALLPEIIEGDEIAGSLTARAARELGLPQGLPMMAGIVDGSAGMLLAPARPGQLFNVCGSTDVLAMCTDQPAPHEKLLTRALGVKQLWLSVGTLAAAGSALYWAKKHFFTDLSSHKFRLLLSRLSRAGVEGAAGVTFEPYLAGDRTSVEQRQASFSGLTLATTREEMLCAVINSLTSASAERLALLLRENPVKARRTVIVSGGSEDRLDRLMHRDWQGKWIFKPLTEATLRGLGTLVPKER